MTGEWEEVQKASEEFPTRSEPPQGNIQVSITQLLTELTPEQESKIPEFVEKWRRIGLSTEPAEHAKAEQGLATIYEKAGLPPPRIIWCTSPLANGLTRAIVKRLLYGVQPVVNPDDEIWTLAKERMAESMSPGFWESLKLSVAASHVYSVGQNIASRICGDGVFGDEFETGWLSDDGSYQPWESNQQRVDTLVRGAAGMDSWERVQNLIENKINEPVSEVIKVIRNSLFDAVLVSKKESKQDEARADDGYGEISNLGEHYGDSFGNVVRASMNHSCYGQHDAAHLGLLDYFRSVCGFESQTELINGQWELAQAAGWYLPHTNICWISEHPNILHINEQNRLHCETGPAIGYPDGWSIFALNGVVLKADYVLTPAEQLNPRIILKESNVDIRRELLRKIGMFRMLQYGKDIDRQGNYRLIDMSPVFRGTEIRYAPYLLVHNPSIPGAQQLEEVSPNCRTVEQAISWQSSEEASKLNSDSSS